MMMMMMLAPQGLGKNPPWNFFWTNSQSWNLPSSRQSWKIMIMKTDDNGACQARPPAENAQCDSHDNDYDGEYTAHTGNSEECDTDYDDHEEEYCNINIDDCQDHTICDHDSRCDEDYVQFYT